MTIKLNSQWLNIIHDSWIFWVNFSKMAILNLLDKTVRHLILVHLAVVIFSVMNGIIDEILESIADQIKSSGLDPLPIPDIDLPFSMDNVIEMTFNIE